MKIKKILLSTLVFAVAAIVCALTVGAEKAGDYQIYATGADTAAITSYSGTATSITIPSKLNGLLRLNATHFVVTQSLQR
mgnify:CR=1 FL=1